MRATVFIFVAMFVSTSVIADTFYDWVELSGTGGSGFLRLTDTNINDPANFEVDFDPSNVLEVQFTFGDGVAAVSAANFDPMSTLQNAPGIDSGNSLYANNGVIGGGWSWLKGPSAPTVTFLDAVSTPLLCVTFPCPLFDVRIRFQGSLIPRAFSNGEWQLRSVPLPAPVLLLAGGLGVLISRGRRRCVV